MLKAYDGEREKAAAHPCHGVSGAHHAPPPEGAAEGLFFMADLFDREPAEPRAPVAQTEAEMDAILLQFLQHDMGLEVEKAIAIIQSIRQYRMDAILLQFLQHDMGLEVEEAIAIIQTIRQYK
jgi:hypothetical protein